MDLDSVPNSVKLSFPNGGLYKTKHHKYFLEGKKEFLTQPGEWYFDTNDKTLYLRLFKDLKPDSSGIRVKTQTQMISQIQII